MKKVFGKNKKNESINEKELDKIKDRLDPDESVEMYVRQSRVRPGGAAILTPNTIFVTGKRVVIRNPVKLGLGEHIEEYFYHQITNIRLEKGILSSSLIFAIPGMTEMSKSDRKVFLWGRNSEGTIDAIPKDVAEKMYDYIRQKIAEEKAKKENSSSLQHPSTTDDPLEILKTRYAKGKITKEEFEEMKKDLE